MPPPSESVFAGAVRVAIAQTHRNVAEVAAAVNACGFFLMLALKGADVGGALASKHRLERAEKSQGDVEMLESEGKGGQGEKRQGAGETGELMQERETVELMQEREAMEMAHGQLQPVEADGREINTNTIAGRDSGMYDDVAGSPYSYTAGDDAHDTRRDHDHTKPSHRNRAQDEPASVSSMSSHEHVHEHEHFHASEVEQQQQQKLQQQHDDLVREDGEAQVTLAMAHMLPVGAGTV